MSKSKRAGTKKRRLSSEVKTKRASRKDPHQAGKRPNSKQARILGLLSRPNGATIASIMRCTGWQQHSVRGFFAGVVRKKLAFKLESEKGDGDRVYRITGGGKLPQSAAKSAGEAQA